MKRKNDIVFLSIVLILLFAGFFILASASLGLAAREGKNPYDSVLKQIITGGGTGLILLFIASRLNYKLLQKFALPIFLFTFVLTLLVLFPQFGFEHGGAQRWLKLGPLTFQPSELLKFGFIIYLSSWLAKRKNEISSYSTGFLPFVIIMGFTATALLAQPDIGTLGIICFTGLGMFFLAGGRYTQISLLIISGLVALVILACIKPHVRDRVLVFLNSARENQGIGYQLSQSKITLGSGGIFGRGFGEGLMKYKNLPEPTGDSIFAIVGEEFGFIGTSLLILLFLLFFYKVMKISLRAQDRFGRLLVSGIAILIIVQIFTNMFAMVGLIPLTGVPLTFISQGGSSLAVTLMGIGIIINVSRH